MVDSATPTLLGQILQTAGLISGSQIQVALVDREYNPNLRLGEILAVRGWLEQQTADFFADEWQFLIQQPEKQPLGYYLEKSGLLSREQIYSVLQEQKQIWIKFGSVAVLKGLIKEKTLNFFLANLFPLALSKSSFVGKKVSPEIDSLDNKQNTIANKATTLEIHDEDIPWID